MVGVEVFEEVLGLVEGVQAGVGGSLVFAIGSVVTSDKTAKTDSIFTRSWL